PVNDPPVGARDDDNERFIDIAWEGGPLSDVDLVLATHPQTTSPQSGTVRFKCDDYPSAYATLHSILMEIYERDLENLIDTVAVPGSYERPDLADIVAGHPETELESRVRVG